MLLPVALEYELGRLDISEVIELYLKAKTKRENPLSFVPSLLQETLESALAEALFMIRKTKQLEIQKYRKTEPSEIRALFFEVEKPMRSYDYYNYMANYLSKDEMPIRTEGDEEALTEAIQESDYLNDCIYKNNGVWGIIMQDFEVVALLHHYNIIDREEKDYSDVMPF